jgi:hypothetical protein
MSSDEERDGVTENSAEWHTACEAPDIERLRSFNTTAEESLEPYCCLRFESGLIADTIRVTSAAACMGELMNGTLLSRVTAPITNFVWTRPKG